MANMVEIVVRVDNAQAGTALAATQSALQEVGLAGEVSMQQLRSGAKAAAGSLDEVGNAGKKMGQHITTSLDGVRLMSQEFGFRLPRALESMLSRMPAVTTAISSMMGAFAGIAIAEVFVRMGESAYNLYEKYISLTAAANDYNKEVQKHKDEAFVDTHSIEVTTQRIDEATNVAKNFQTVAQQLHAQGLQDLGSGFLDPYHLAKGAKELYDARDAANSGYKSQGQSDALKVKQVEQEHEISRLKIEQAHAGDDALRGQAKLNAELEKQKQLHQEDQNYGRARDSALQPFGMHDGGQQRRDIENYISQRENAAKKIELQREITDKTIQLQNEATNAGLQGGALMLAQEKEAIATIGRSATGTLAQIQAVKDKYAAENKRHLDEENDAVQKRAELERDAALTGLAKVQAEGQRKIDDVNDREKKGLYTDPKNADKDRATATADKLRMMGDAQKQYEQQQAQEDKRAAMEQLTGFAKIDAQVAASTQERADDFTKMYGQMAHDSAIYINAQEDLGRHVSDDVAAGDRERAQLEDQLRQQTIQKVDQAAQAERRVKQLGIMGWKQDYLQGISDVRAEEADSIKKMNDKQGESGVTATAWNLYQQQKVAAEQKADAEIQSLNQQMAQQIGGVLQGAFDDPIHYIQNAMKKMMFQILADWIMQSKSFSGIFGKMIGAPHPQGVAAASGINSGTFGIGGAAQGAVSGASGSSGATSPSLGSGGSFAGSMLAAGPIAQAGLSTAMSNASGAVAAGTGAAGTDPWNDPTQMSSSASATGSSAASSGAQTDSTIGGVLGAGAASYAGVKGMMGAFESGNALGIFNGGASGAAMGASIGMLAGPMGAAIGGGVGAATGAVAGLVGWATGEGGNLGASKYFKTQMKKPMEDVEMSYARGGGDALSAIAQINQMAASGYQAMASQFGMSSANWARAAYIDKERVMLTQQINSMASGGRDYMSRASVQFHTGGDVNDFGGLSLGGGEGFIKALLGEKVANRTASSIHGGAIDMMNDGASATDMAAHYLKTTGAARTQSAASNGGDTHNWTVHAIDASSFEKMLTSGGGIEAISRASNQYVSRYAGDASNG